MENNSITSNMGSDSIISSIKLLLGENDTCKNGIIVVEGDDDCKFLKKFKNENTVIYESFAGKEGVLSIIEHPVIQNCKVVGIRDRDYIEENIHDRIFFYDFSCLEMMILKSDNSHKSICCEHYNGSIPRNDLKFKILKDLEPLSILRKENEKRNIGINFKGLNINGCYNNLIFNKDKLKELLNSLQGKSGINVYGFFENEETEDRDLYDYLKITNGHDFIASFHHHCTLDSNRKGKGVGIDAISSAYRMSYNLNDFKETELFNNIKKYSEDNNLNIFIS